MSCRSSGKQQQSLCAWRRTRTRKRCRKWGAAAVQERAGAERRRGSDGRRRVDQAETGSEPDAEPHPLSGPGRPGHSRRDPAEALQWQQQQQYGGGWARPFCGWAERHGQPQRLWRRFCRDPRAWEALPGPIWEPGSAARLCPRRRPAPEILRELRRVLISAAFVDVLAAIATFKNLPL